MPYRFILTSLAGDEVSELPRATGKRISIPVAGMATSSAAVPGDTDDADFLLEGDALVRIYETAEDDEADRTLLGHHRLISAEEVGTDQGTTVAAAFADPTWVLSRRLVGKAAGGYTRGTALVPVDRGTIISELVDATNLESPTGVRMGTVTPSSSTYIEGWFYKPLAEAIAELGATLDGPDWRIRPIEYDAGVIGELDVVPSLSTVRDDAPFEYGEGTLANVRGFRRAVSLEGTLNRVISLPPGFPDNAVGVPLERDDAPSQAQRGLLEGLVTTGLNVDSLRAALLDHHVAVRKGPRQTITLEPVRDLGGRVPRFGRDFDVGDVLPFRAKARDSAGELVQRIDAYVRVYSYDVAVDEAGYGTPSVTVTPS